MNGHPTSEQLDPSPIELEERPTAKVLAARARADLEADCALDALHHADELLVAFPNERQGFVLKAQALLQLGRAAEALQTVDGALVARERDGKLLGFARTIALKQNDRDAAARYALKLSEIVPDDPKNELFLIDWQLAEEPANALERATRLTAAHPELTPAFIKKAETLIRLGQPEHAIATLEDAAVEHRHDRQLLEFGRNLSLKQGQSDVAAKFALLLSEIAPGDLRNELILTDWHLVSGEFANAVRRADALLALHPQAAHAVLMQAQAFVELGDPDKALDAIRRSLDHHGDNRKLLGFGRNVALEYRGLEVASEFALRLAEVAPGDLKNALFVLEWELANGSFASAIRRADMLTEMHPQSPQPAILKAEAFLKLEQPDEALRTVRESLPLHGENVQLLSLGRNISSRLLGADAASEFALRLTEVEPHNVKNELFLIEWHLASGDAEAALRRSERLIGHCSEVPQASMLQAQALLNLDEPGRALSTLDVALERHGENTKLLSLARNVAFGLRAHAASTNYALRLATIAREDIKNRIFLIQCCLASGDFADALAHADALLSDEPADLAALMLRAQALIALHRVTEALTILQEALEANPNDRRLLSLARSVAFQNGRFMQAAQYAQRFSELAPGDERNKAFVIHAQLATLQFSDVERFFDSLGGIPEKGVLRKEHHYFHQYGRMKRDAPALASAWELALGNSVERKPRPTGNCDLGAIMIQYWSQGTPPPDVQIICDNWKEMFEREKLGRVELFDRATAAAWINEFAPEFNSSFSHAFHYAMESDIFRIAYASKRPCIYMDIDSWPLEHTPEILRMAVTSGDTMLYLRAHRPVIVNGFFVSSPDCPFVQELVSQCLAIDVDKLPKDYLVLEGTFGPSRYSKVFLDLLKADGGAAKASAAPVPGSSVIALRTGNIYFSHEAAVASVRPPFPLGYKATDDYWKFISLPD